MQNLGIATPIIVAAGLIVCGGGWFLFRLSVRILGFIAGAWAGYLIYMLAAASFSFDPRFTGTPGIVSASVVVLFFGLLGAFAVRVVVKLVLFVSGVFFGLLMSSAAAGFPLSRFEIGSFEAVMAGIPLWAAVASLVFGVLFVVFERTFIILYTSASGAYLVSTVLGAPSYIFFALVASGALLQFRLSRGEDVKNLEIIPAEKVRGPR